MRTTSVDTRNGVLVRGILGAIAVAGTIANPEVVHSAENREAPTAGDTKSQAGYFKKALKALINDHGFRSAVKADPSILTKKYPLTADQVTLIYQIWLAAEPSAANLPAPASCDGPVSCCCCCCC